MPMTIVIDQVTRKTMVDKLYDILHILCEVSRTKPVVIKNLWNEPTEFYTLTDAQDVALNLAKEEFDEAFQEIGQINVNY